MKDNYFFNFRYFLFLLLFGIALATISCDDEDLKADIPAFLTINQVTLTTTPNQGSASANISNVNVFVNDQSLGFFELPASIPIREVGNVNIKIRAVIENNGRSGDKVVYPFYTGFELDTVLKEEQEITINPEITYFETTIFAEPWSGENFESGVNFEHHIDSDTILVRLNDPNESFEGTSGLAMLSKNATFFEARTPAFSNIPRSGLPVYLELDFKSTHTFLISIYTNNRSDQNTIVFLRPQTGWTKVYVELGSIFSAFATAFDFNIAIGYVKDQGEVGRLLLDNVKLVHF